MPSLGSRGALLRQEMGDLRMRARSWTREHGEDLPLVRDWSWGEHRPDAGASPSTVADPDGPADHG